MNLFEKYSMLPPPNPEVEDIEIPELKAPSIEKDEIGDRFYTYTPPVPSKESKIDTIPAAPFPKRKKIRTDIEDDLLDREVINSLNKEEMEMDDLSADDLLTVCSAYYDLALK